MKRILVWCNVCLWTLCLTCVSVFADQKDGRLDIYFIDVEGGASTLIVTPAGESVLIDSGNASYRAGNFAGAAKRYASAAVVKPDDAAAFYGLGMALAKLGRDEEARVAYAKSRALLAAAADTATAR